MYAYVPRGVCSQLMTVALDEKGRISDIGVLGGCSGNLQGLTAMCKERDAKEVIAILRGIRCGMKPTSCPDQLSFAIEQALLNSGKERESGEIA